ncbi:substrate-binding domain-containing protein [Glycomyces albidus]|uniref:Substrate-binding domain-containing protein n=1 Tax=Glycomyces albidus TaxID=2656774 RepID=A0A6L5G400_9ACTN|nr:substrate-binding domain-containing protein [Glycomyces albidus]MQM24208.1 substrate-binding domain-containing protein [Glycomyces albidus]
MESLRGGDPERIGPYTLIARLGAGAMGQVYLGEDGDGRRAAVKLLNPELAVSPEYRERFAREFAAARRVAGDRTAHVVDADPEAERPWLATAHIPGPTLREHVFEHGPLGPAAAAALGVGLAEGLAAIHACGLIHRDLKPSNVIMAEDGPRIIDFGIARAVDASTLTGTGTVLGTYGFMSPEQITADTAGTPSDVFALGCVLAFAATGNGPFDASTVPAVIHRVLSEPPRLDGVPHRLRPVLEACLAKAPEQRPTTDELRVGLTAVTDPPTAVDPDAGVPDFAPGRSGPAAPFPAGDTVVQPTPPDAKRGPARRALLAGVVAALAAAVPLWLLLDRDDSLGGGSGGDAKRIGIALPHNSEPRWNYDGEQLTSLFEAAGHDVLLQYADGTADSQATQIERMLEDGVDALVVAVIDPAAERDALERARDAGVPVVAYDRLVEDGAVADYYVGFDLARVGALQSQYIVDRLGLDGQTGPFRLEVFAGASSDPVARLFFDGAWEVLRPYVEQGRLVVPSGQTSLEQTATERWDSALARSRMEDLLASFYDDGTRLDAVLSPYDGITAGVIDAIQNADIAMPLVVGHDPSAESLAYLEDGLQAMTVFNDPSTLAQATVDLLATVLAGEDPAAAAADVPSVYLEPVAVDAQNCQEVLIDSGYLDPG